MCIFFLLRYLFHLFHLAEENGKGGHFLCVAGFLWLPLKPSQDGGSLVGSDFLWWAQQGFKSCKVVPYQTPQKTPFSGPPPVSRAPASPGAPQLPLPRPPAAARLGDAPQGPQLLGVRRRGRRGLEPLQHLRAGRAARCAGFAGIRHGRLWCPPKRRAFGSASRVNQPQQRCPPNKYTPRLSKQIVRFQVP